MFQSVKSSSVTVRQNLLSSERRIALVVGVDEAPNSVHPTLRHAVADANAMAEVLEQQCNFELLDKPFVNEYATSANIKRAILELKRNRNDNDFLLFYFSGHGFPWSFEVGGDDVYLVTHDFSQEEVSDDPSLHISFKWLREKLYVENKAKKVVIILDCCYAGNMSLIAPDLYLEEIQQRLNYYFDAPGANSGAKIGGLRQTLAATCHNSTALERDGHGLMTNWLLSALEGKADDALDSEGLVTLLTLRSYLQSKMPNHRPPSLSGGDAGHYCVLAYFPDRNRKLVISHLLTTGMTVLPTDYASRIQNFFTEYLGTPQSPVPFGGRESDLAYLHAWLDDPKVPPYLLLAAPAGRGKSALLVRWSKELIARTDLAVIFLPVSIRFRTNLAGVVFTSLTARLAFLHGEKIPATLDTSLEVWRGLMTDYLARPLPDGKRLILILDGVDEAADWEASPDLFPLAPPKGLRIIVSARYLAGHSDARPWLRRIGWNHANLAHTLVLNPLTFDGIADVLMSMGFPLDRLGIRTDIVTELFRLSEGDPLLVRLYVDDLWDRGEAAARLRPEDLCLIRPGMEGYFSRWWEDQRSLWGDKVPLREPAVQTLLSILACALGPLSQEDVLQLAPTEIGLTNWALEEDLHPLNRFVIGDGRHQGYVFNHPRLGSYFYEERLSARERHAVEARFLTWGEETCTALNQGNLLPEQVSPYIVQYYGAHLERAGRSVEELLSLVSNGWQLAWEKLEGAFTGFLNDTGRAWRAVEHDNKSAIGAGLLAPYLGGEVRCALCRASINSLAKNISPDLLIDIVEKGIWTPIQGLSYARHIADLEQRVQALARLTPYLTDHLKGEVIQEALEATHAIIYKASRIKALIYLAAHLPEALKWEVVQEGLKLAQEIVEETDRARALAILVPHLTDELKDQVILEMLEGARTLEGEAKQLSVLMALAPYLSKPLLKVALEVVQLTEWEDHRIIVLLVLASNLPQELKSEVVLKALEAVRSTEGDLRQMLPVLVPHLPQTLRSEVVQEALNSLWSQGRKERTLMLLLLIPYLPPTIQSEMVREELDTVWLHKEGTARALVLTNLAPYMSEAQMQEVLKTVLIKEEETARALTLAALVPYLPEKLKGEGLQETLKAVWTIREESTWARVLALLAPHMTEKLLQEALESAQAIRDDAGRIEVLITLAPHHPDAQKDQMMQELLKAAWLIRHEVERAEVLVALIPHLPGQQQAEVIQKALETAQTIKGKAERARILAQLALHLPGQQQAEVMQKVLRTAWAIREKAEQSRSAQYEESQIELLASIFSRLPEGLKEEIVMDALKTTQTIRGSVVRVRVLLTLIPHLSEMLKDRVIQEALEIARTIKEKEVRVRILVKLALHLPEMLKDQVIQEALEAAWAIKEESKRANVLKKLALHLPEAKKDVVIQEVLKATSAIRKQAENNRSIQYSAAHAQDAVYYEVTQVEILATLASHLPEMFKDQVMQEILQIARFIDRKEARVRAMAILIPHYPKTQKVEILQEALATARTIKFRSARVRAFTILVTHLPEMLKDQVIKEALEAARMTKEKSGRAYLLIQLIPFLTEIPKGKVIDEVLGIARMIREKGAKGDVLAALAPHLPLRRKEEVMREALEVAREVAYEGSRVRVLAALAPHLSEILKYEVVQEALKAVWMIEEEELRVRALVALGPYLSESQLQKALQEVLKLGNKLERAQALISLVPYLSELSMQEVLKASGNLLDEAGQVHVLRSLIPLLPEPLLPDVLEIARNMRRGAGRTWLLTMLTPRLPMMQRDEVVSEALDVLREIAYEGVRVEVLAGLIPHLSERLKDQVKEEILEAVQRVRKCAEWEWAFGYERSRLEVLTALVPHLPETMKEQVVSEVLDAAQTVREKSWRARLLAMLIPHLPERLKGAVTEEALKIARTLAYEGVRVEVLSEVVPYLQDTLKDDVVGEGFKTAWMIEDEDEQAKVLIKLAPYLTETQKKDIVQKTLGSVRAMEDEAEQAQVLIKLAPHLSEPLLREVLEEARAMKDEAEQARVLAAIIPHFSEPLLREVLEEVHAIWKDPILLTEIGHEGSLEPEVEFNQEWIEILTTMSAYLSEALFQEALEAVQAIPYEGPRAEALVALAPHLPEALLQEALDITRAIPYERPRAEALVALAPHLPEALKDEAVLEALETVWEFDENGVRARLLAALIPCIPESLKDEIVQEALKTARYIEEESSRSEIELVTTLFSSLSGPLLQEALEMAFSTLQPINYEESKAATLTKLVPYVPESIKSEVMRDAFEAARSMKKKNDRARVLVDLAPHLAKLSPSGLYPLWREALHILAYRSRQDLLINLQSLAPIISVLGGSKAIVETSRAILEVGNWWP